MNCFHIKTNVTNSRGHKKTPQTWRRRTCPECGFTFTTYETFALDEVLLVKIDDKSIPYNRGRLLASLINALKPTGDDLSKAYLLVATIEEKILLMQRGPREWQPISTALIAKVAYDTLLAYNVVAGYTYGSAHKLISISQKKRPGRPINL